ncbi:Folate-sensitive fragile site protein Fra10Ac1 family protein [Brugia pahangi]
MNKQNPSIDYEDLESEFDYANDAGSSVDRRKSYRIQDDQLWKKPRFGEVALPDRKKAKGIFDQEQSCFERRKQRLMTLDVYTRHKELINQYYLCYPGATAKLQRDTSRDRTDYDVLKDNHRFLWDDDELMKAAEKSWEARLAKRYYDKLFKEYCIADLSQYKKNRIAMRWRTEREVRSGKGQFECGNKRSHASSQKSEETAEQTNTSDVQQPAVSEETSEEVEQNIDEKLEKDNLMEIWRKSPEDTDPEKIAEQELDDFLDDLLL